MKRFVLAVLSLFALTATPGSALAQFERSDVYDTPMGSIYVSTLPDAYQPHLYIGPSFVPFDIYIVADIDFGDIGAASQNLTNGIRAWEGGVTAPPELTLIGQDWEGAFNLGQGAFDYIVGIGTPILSAESTPRPLVTLSFLSLHGYSVPFEMHITPASVQSFPNVSVWIEELTLNGCQNVVSHLPTQCFFVWAFMGPLIIQDVAIEGDSFGGLKARFDR